MRPGHAYCRHTLGAAFYVAAMLAVAGCGEKLYPVEGTVTFEDGTPLTAGTVEFELAAPPHTRAAGRLDKNGHFTLSTTRAGSGALQGENKVRVLPDLPERFEVLLDPDPAKARALLVDRRYLDFETSGLRYTITPGRNDFTVQIRRPQD